VLPRWAVPAATITAVLSYAAWTAAAASDGFTGQGVVTLVFAALFWLSLMVLAAAAVQKGVDRYRSGADPDRREGR
jgi:cation transporter-like permease